jgi:hypothetical protein
VTELEVLTVGVQQGVGPMRLDPLSVGHDVVELNLAVEDPARVDASGEDVAKQAFDLGAGGSRATCKGDVQTGQAPESDRGRLVARHADAADHAECQRSIRLVNV